MAIWVQEDKGIFHLQSTGMSYVIGLVNGYPAHLYWGGRLREGSNLEGLLLPVAHGSLDRLPQEYPQYGTGDYRVPAYQAKLEDGTRVTQLRYSGYRVTEGKPELAGLPSVYVESPQEADTLELILKDDYSKLTVTLRYTVYKELNVIARSVEFINDGPAPLQLQRALSASVDFPSADMDMIYLSGAWSRQLRDPEPARDEQPPA
jgi:alpha-galactosidase